MDNIPLEVGDNPLHPRMCICPKCGGDTSELAIGAIRKAQTSKGWVYAQRGQTSKVRARLQEQGIYETLQWIKLDENERVPSSSLCEDCEQEAKEHAEVVAQGGVYFKCLKCNLTGVMKPDTSIAKHVRTEMGIEAPNPVGIESNGCGEPDGLDFGGMCPLKGKDNVH